VKKVLAEAKAAKADLGKLKTRYKNDKAAYKFLTGGGEQDRLIDESIKKLEAALKGEAPAAGKKKTDTPAIARKDPTKGKDKKPAGGVIRVVLVREDGRWLAYFCTDPTIQRRASIPS